MQTGRYRTGDRNNANPDDVIARGERTRTRTHPSADRLCAIQDREREELTVVKSYGEIFHRLLCAWVPYLGVEDAISWSVIAIKRHFFSVVDTS